ncbi:MAG: nuclear transport factor 2 family protein [Acidobacteria bacterium]|nr:nuclear transport factor 2 family protein [Acidobacteriota bacterium]
MIRVACLVAALAVAGWFPDAARSAEPGTPEQEIIAVFGEKIVDGYGARDAAKILSMYDGEARVATFTRGVLDRATFAAMLQESIAQSSAMKVTLEVGAVEVLGDTARVPLRLILESTDAGGKNRVTSDRLYCTLKRRDGWKIVVQTYRKDFTLPPDAAAPALHH